MISSTLTYSSADDLNALYVYETKMSLLIQISQTRQGAERLLESNVIPVLSQCDYLDARPEVDQMFVGAWRWQHHSRYVVRLTIRTDQSSLLPSAIQRYHQLFMPTLQLINGVLMTLGSSHQTATSQVCISNHVELTLYNVHQIINTGPRIPACAP